MANARTKARIEARIRERAAYCVEFELNDPRSAFVTVTGVEVSTDLSVAKILYSVLGSESDRSRVAHMLEDATGFVRKQIGRVLRTRRIPRLVWIYDDSMERQEEMERAITDALERDRRINPEAHQLPSPTGTPDEAQELDREIDEFLDARDEEEG